MPQNNLNDLTAKEWTKFKKSWFIHDGKEVEWKLKREHPATYPAAIAEQFIQFFTQEGDTVLDPTMGSGSTLIAAARSGRNAIGIELYKKWIAVFDEIVDAHYPEYRNRLFPYIEVLHGEAVDTLTTLKSGSADYIFFSPPYYNTLGKSSGGGYSRHKDRAKEGLALEYGDDEDDAGNMEEEKWMMWMEALALSALPVVRRGRYMTIVVQNEVRKPFNPIAWKLALRIAEETPWELKAERIWCQDSKGLTIHGWPKTYLTNNHHHYCLTFQAPE